MLTPLPSNRNAILQGAPITHLNRSSKGKFEGLQALRFWAAVLVVAMHATQAAAQHILQIGPHAYWERGGIGVHIFFVLSGFVMSHSTPPEGGWTASLRFIRKRLIRIAPPYWFYTTIKLMILGAAMGEAMLSRDELWSILSSYIFFPSHNRDGVLLPILQVGWTLNFEIVFYAIFASAVFFSRNRILFSTTFITLIFFLSNQADSNSVSQFYARGIIFEFLYGMLIAELSKRNMIARPRAALILAIISLIALAMPTTEAIDTAITVGIPAAIIVYSVIALEAHPSPLLHHRWLMSLGDASYSLYLTHSIFIIAAARLCSAASFSYEWTVFVLIGGSIALSLITHRFIETPLMSWVDKLIPRTN